MQKKSVTDEKIIVLSHESYHEGVIGLAAGRLVEEFYRPSIVLSKKGDIAKGSARSVSGFNIIEAIRKLDDLIIEGGGHPMAAGFSIKTSKIEIFTKRINELGKKELTDELLEKKARVDVRLEFNQINWKMFEQLKKFEPSGLGNPQPTFMAEGIEVVDAKTVGQDKRHLKLRLRQNEQLFDAIYFGGGGIYSDLTPDSKVDVVYQLEANTWNNHRSLQLKVKDLRLSN